MELIALRLRNFKGKKELDITLDGKDASIFGDNATGKTTIKDGVSWLLFGKDSQGRAQFEIKTLDHANRPYPKLDHSVEGTFKTDEGRVVKLHKVLREKYTTPRGKSAEVFDGHETKYFIDDAPKKKKDYAAKVAELTADEHTFQLLTSPDFFPSMSWQRQRELLLEVCGGIDDGEVITANDELADLAGLMEERSLDEFKDMVVNQRRAARKEIDAIPGRVDEASRAIPELEVRETKPIVNKLKGLAKKLGAKDDEINSIKNGGGIPEKRLKLSELDGTIVEARNRYKAGSAGAQDAQRAKLRTRRDSLESDIDSSNGEKKRATSRAKDCVEEIAKLEADKEVLGARWAQVKKMAYEEEDICPTCHQSLPEDQIEEARKRFNERKANDLAAIVASGNAHNERIKELSAQLEHHEAAIAECKETADELLKGFNEVRDELARLNESATPFEETGEYQKLMEQRAKIEEELNSLQFCNNEVLEKASKAKAAIQAEIDANNAIISDINLAQKQHDRIAELNREQEALAARIEEYDRRLWLVEQFEKSRAQTLQDKVSAQFNLVTFKLFKQQINEGIQPTCEAMVNGIPYSSLNSAARVQAGLDIITTLSGYYGFHPPVVIDGAESITSLPEMTAQVVQLIVAEADKELRVQL